MNELRGIMVRGVCNEWSVFQFWIVGSRNSFTVILADRREGALSVQLLATTRCLGRQLRGCGPYEKGAQYTQQH